MSKFNFFVKICNKFGFNEQNFGLQVKIVEIYFFFVLKFRFLCQNLIFLLKLVQIMFNKVKILKLR